MFLAVLQGCTDCLLQVSFFSDSSMKDSSQTLTRRCQVRIGPPFGTKASVVVLVVVAVAVAVGVLVVRRSSVSAVLIQKF